MPRGKGSSAKSSAANGSNGHGNGGGGNGEASAAKSVSQPTQSNSNNNNNLSVTPASEAEASVTASTNAMSQVDSHNLIELVKDIGKKHERSEDEIGEIVNKLDENWITTLSQLLSMDSAQRRMLGLPVVLEQELEDIYNNVRPTPSASSAAPTPPERKQSESPISYCYIYQDKDSITCSINDLDFVYHLKTPIEKLYNQVGDCKAYTEHNKCIHPSTPIGKALKPGRELVIGDQTYEIMYTCSFKAVCHWLRSLELGKYAKMFLDNNINDFLILPFLRGNDLDDIGMVNADDKRKILTAVKNLSDTDNYNFVGQWIAHLGFSMYSSSFVQNKIGLEVLPLIKEKDLIRMGIKECHKSHLFELIKQYSEFSSVEATYLWLKSKGFDEYAFQFVRYNIPFYALPLVNFFIINEMGFTKHNQKLLTALTKLKNSPSYNVKAMACWLRDLEMERYTQIFAKNLLVNFIEALTILTDHMIHRLIDSVEDREKMRRAVHDMKEFQLYYSATASLLQEIVMEKYAHIFAVNGVSMDLPLLTDEKLLAMGITDYNDRQQILECIKKMKEELPCSTGGSTSSILSMSRNGSAMMQRDLEEFLEFDGFPPKPASRRANKQRRKTCYNK